MKKMLLFMAILMIGCGMLFADETATDTVTYGTNNSASTLAQFRISATGVTLTRSTTSGYAVSNGTGSDVYAVTGGSDHSYGTGGRLQYSLGGTGFTYNITASSSLSGLYAGIPSLVQEESANGNIGTINNTDGGTSDDIVYADYSSIPNDGTVLHLVPTTVSESSVTLLTGISETSNLCWTGETSSDGAQVAYLANASTATGEHTVLYTLAAQ